MDDAPSVPRIRLGASPELAQDARARAWLFVFACYEKKEAAERAPTPNGCDDVPSVRNVEGVSHVDQLPD